MNLIKAIAPERSQIKKKKKNKEEEIYLGIDLSIYRIKWQMY